MTRTQRTPRYHDLLNTHTPDECLGRDAPISTYTKAATSNGNTGNIWIPSVPTSSWAPEVSRFRPLGMMPNSIRIEPHLIRTEHLYKAMHQTI